MGNAKGTFHKNSYASEIIRELKNRSGSANETDLPIPKIKSKSSKRSPASWRHVALYDLERKGLVTKGDYRTIRVRIWSLTAKGEQAR
jgi:DNA-binding HxlR family transcriptional regulator